MNSWWIVVSALAICTHSCLGANILAVLPVSSKSHHILFQPLFRELALRGHNVTVLVDTNHLKEPLANLTEIVISSTLAGRERMKDTMKILLESPMTARLAFKLMSNVGQTMCTNTLSNNRVQAMLHSEQRFDLVMAEISLAQECFLGLSYRFRAPVVALTTFPGKENMEYYTGNPNPASYLPNWLTPYNDHMTFLERAINAYTIAEQLYLVYFHLLPIQEALMKEYIPDADKMPPILDMLANISIVLHNSQIGLTYARPYNPNIIEVGGMHIPKIQSPLPKDLAEFMDSAKEGVVYFSLGSTPVSQSISEETKQAFVQVFGELKQKVLWKLDADTLPDLPNNVKLQKWLPQHEILAHENCKAFISHGGMLSVTEAIHFGVPLLGFPFFGDQNMNLAFVQSKGIGLKMDFSNVSYKSVSWALHELLDNPVYYSNMKRQSSIFKDHPLPPMENAIYWIEYVLRHKGAPHLQTAAVLMSWFKYFLVDALLTAALVISLLVWIVVSLCKRCFTKKQHKD